MREREERQPSRRSIQKKKRSTGGAGDDVEGLATEEKRQLDEAARRND
jgi:hypothetical protein